MSAVMSASSIDQHKFVAGVDYGDDDDDDDDRTRRAPLVSNLDDVTRAQMIGQDKDGK